MKFLAIIFLVIFIGCSSKTERGISSVEKEEGFYFRDKDRTFNKKNEFKVGNNKIYHRRPGASKWKELKSPLGRAVTQIGVDSDQMVAVDVTGQVFWSKNAFNRVFLPNSFTHEWGSPLGKGPGIWLPKDTTAWEFSYLSPKEDIYYTDDAGNRHFIGVGVTTLYALRNKGQWITYLDPWLPSDYSYEVCGPVRGRFLAQNISASGSVLFLINKFGDMYTRTYDFDIAGGDNLFFWYTYDKDEARKLKTHRDKGHPMFYESLFNRRLISVTGWKTQPKIKGTITDRISIIKAHEGGTERILRVEGVDENGKSGFFQKTIFGSKWKFIATGQAVKGNKISNSSKSGAHLTLGKDESHRYTMRGRGYTLKIDNFHPYCSPSNMRVIFKGGKELKLTLHTRERIRLNPTVRGVGSHVLKLDGALEVPREVLENLPALPRKIRRFISRNLKNKRFTNIQMKVTKSRLTMFPNKGEVVKDILADIGRDPLTNLNPLVHLEKIKNMSSVNFKWRFKAR